MPAPAEVLMAFSPLGRGHFKGVERISQESPANRVPSLSLSGMNVLATSRERSQNISDPGHIRRS